MTCIYNVDVPEKDTSCVVQHKPLPGVLTDFIAESMCGILETHQPPKCYNWDFVPLPELVFFVEKVTTKAKIDVHTAIAALILVSRLKERLPKNAHGEYGTCHKIFLSALLVALKEFMTKTQEEDDRPYSSAPPTCCSSPIPPEEELSIDSNSSSYSSSSSSSSDFDHSNNILSTTPLSTSSSLMSDDDQEILPSTTPHHRHHHHHNNNKYHRRHSIVNQRLAEISGIYTLQEINNMEKTFIKLLGQHNTWVDEKDIRDFVENNKYALGLC